MVEVGMAVQNSIQTRLGIIRYILHPYCFSSNGISVKSSRDVRCTLLSLAYSILVCIHFCTAIPTSTINFSQTFFYAYYCTFLSPLGTHWLPTLESILAYYFVFVQQYLGWCNKKVWSSDMCMCMYYVLTELSCLYISRMHVGLGTYEILQYRFKSYMYYVAYLLTFNSLFSCCTNDDNDSTVKEHQP